MELLVNCFNQGLLEPMRMCLKMMRRCNGGINRIKYQPVGQHQIVMNQINH